MRNLIVLAAAMLLGWNAMSAQEFALSTNLIGLADMGTLNIDAAYGVARHWTVDAGVRYNPFSFGKGEDIVRRRQRAISVGTRYWPWHIFSGWWVSGGVRYQEYNAGGFVSKETSEGDRFGGGFGGGYTCMITPHFNIDIGAGAWTGYDVYTTYSCPTCGRIVEKGSKFFILPSDILLSLTYIF